MVRKFIALFSREMPVELSVEQIEERPGIGLSGKMLKTLNVKPGSILTFRYGTGIHESRVWLADNGHKPKSSNGAVISSVISSVYRLHIGDTIHVVRPPRELNPRPHKAPGS